MLDSHWTLRCAIPLLALILGLGLAGCPQETDDDATDDDGADDDAADDDGADDDAADDDGADDDAADDDTTPPPGAPIADHEAAADFDLIPQAYFDQIRDDYAIFYGHTSHGSQVVSGLDVLAGEDSLYEKPSFHEISDDLGHTGDTSWVAPTEDALDTGSYDVAMWSWCGGCSDNTDEGIDAYLAAMEQLEADYPSVVFVYMTGHLDGSGVAGLLYHNNDRIRQYCEDHDKILFDFADIESWDPDGNYFPDETDSCNWCTDWCASHECPDCGCAHSQCFNCYQKGRAWWWMMARIAGWDGT